MRARSGWLDRRGRRPRRSGRKATRSFAKTSSGHEKALRGDTRRCACGGGCPRCAGSGPAVGRAADRQRVTVHAGSGGGAPGPATAPAAPADPIASDPTVLAGFFCLLKDANYGTTEWERASWIVSAGAGHSLVRWPWSGEEAKETWKGALPSGTVGLGHTHPNSKSERPSTGDKDVAAKHGIPVYAITTGTIWRTDGPSSPDVQVGTSKWYKPYKKTKC